MRTFPFGKGAILGALIVGLLVTAACAGPAGPAGPKGDAGPPGPAGKTPTTAELKALIAEALRGAPATVASIARGGRLYDHWTEEAKVAVPAGNQPLWATQTTNTRTGDDTWRCKECHGWDYKGVGGAYGSGSHKTGFVGVYDAGTSKSQEQLLGILSGSTNARHDFSKVLDGQSLTDLANFLSQSLINETPYIDYATKKPIGGNATKGKTLFDATCVACHGADGKTLNFGDAAAPEYLGTTATDNPWETINKIRFGQPGKSMPSGAVNGWSMQDVVDVLTYAQTLPTK
ncbi:MAG: c-type cytochrome [Chloroflexi bacterium]|nr:c-type cytochrome [Chloroflexota bacterium]